MTSKDFFMLVEQMRQAQKVKEKYALSFNKKKCEELEENVDDEIARVRSIIEQKNSLF